MRSTTAAYLARALAAQGRLDEADALAEEARQLGAPDDEATQSAWRMARARVLAHRGSAEEAEALAREALALLAPTDVLVEKAEAEEVLADVLAAAGDAAGAGEALRRAVELYDRKGATVLAGRARRRVSAS
jgi:tetratricopeptide (TPR) repeat protein